MKSIVRRNHPGSRAFLAVSASLLLTGSGLAGETVSKYESIEFSKVGEAQKKKLFIEWIKTHQAVNYPDGSRELVRHTHTRLCKQKGFCSVSEDDIVLHLRNSTNQLMRCDPAVATIRLEDDVDGEEGKDDLWGSPDGWSPAENVWLVEVIDVATTKFTSKRNTPDVGWILVDFEDVPTDKLYFDRLIKAPLRLVGTRSIDVIQSRKLEFPVKTVKTIPLFRLDRPPEPPPVRCVKPSMDDFKKWFDAGNSMEYKEKFTTTCPSCSGRGRWTEWDDGRQTIRTCYKCGGSRSIWVEKTITVKKDDNSVRSTSDADFWSN